VSPYRVGIFRIGLNRRASVQGFNTRVRKSSEAPPSLEVAGELVCRATSPVSAGPVRLYSIGPSRRASVPGFTTRVRRSREALSYGTEQES
jgi:hypothetical protein